MNIVTRNGGSQNILFDIIARNYSRATFVTYSTISIYLLIDSEEIELPLVEGVVGSVIDYGFVHYSNGTYQLGIPGQYLTANKKQILLRFSGNNIFPNTVLITLRNARIAR